MMALVLTSTSHPDAAFATAIFVNLLTHVFAFITALEVILMQQPKVSS